MKRTIESLARRLYEEFGVDEWDVEDAQDILASHIGKNSGLTCETITDLLLCGAIEVVDSVTFRCVPDIVVEEEQDDIEWKPTEDDRLEQLLLREIARDKELSDRVDSMSDSEWFQYVEQWKKARRRKNRRNV